ncbi:hypothetical protein Tco_0654948 [Tanacetum coccineum]|uniref:Uncharacterized protein n=1 Tax=Tanacetum coccineum TaxID=301880 RepID=A0ABQ4X4P4_9ASTR
MCRQPLPPPLSPPSVKLMIMALEEYGYQSRRGIRIRVEAKDGVVSFVTHLAATVTVAAAKPMVSTVAAAYCTDKAKTTRKRLKPGKHEHKNGRARKKPGGSHQSQTMVKLQSTWSTKVKVTKGQNSKVSKSVPHFILNYKSSP